LKFYPARLKEIEKRNWIYLLNLPSLGRDAQTKSNFIFLYRFNYKTLQMQKNWKFKTGISLIILSTLLFLSLLAVPFIHVEGKAKITITTITIIIGEITFWVGGILLGKELFNKYKAYLNPKNWFKKKNTAIDNSIENEDNTNL